MRICAVIQASGMSKRMGTDKLRLPVKGMEMYKYIIKEVSKAKLDKVILVSKDEEILDYGKKHGFSTIINVDYKMGQSRSIVLAMQEMKDFDAIMFFVADQPFLKVETIEKLIEEFGKTAKSIVIPLYNGKRGSPVIFSSIYKEDLMALKGEERGRLIIEKHLSDVEFIDIEDGLQGIDIDNMEDYERYCV